MISLKVRLKPEQVAAATRLHVELPSWKTTDAALDLLAVQLPGFDKESCLLKATAINQLYGTNVYALNRVARHVFDVMKEPDRDLVERLALVTNGPKPRRHLSVASRSAHFYVDKDTYAIFDSYAVRTLRHHLASVRLPYDDPPRYADFVEALTVLVESSGIQCSGRELDRYVWLGGLCRIWKKGQQRSDQRRGQRVLRGGTTAPRCDSRSRPTPR